MVDYTELNHQNRLKDRLAFNNLEN
jgi:hypothetical protein